MMNNIKIHFSRLINPTEEILQLKCFKCGFIKNTIYLCLGCSKRICEDCKLNQKDKVDCCEKNGNSSSFFVCQTDIFKQILSVNLKCQNEILGCKELLAVSNFFFHEELCDHRKYKCPNAGCETQDLQYKDKESHEKQCEFQPTLCNNCKKIFIRKFIDNHLSNECEGRFMSCVNCGKSISLENLKGHSDICIIKKSCGKCGFELDANSQEIHNCILNLKNLIRNKDKENVLAFAKLEDQISSLRSQFAVIVLKSQVQNDHECELKLHKALENQQQINQRLEKEISSSFQRSIEIVDEINKIKVLNNDSFQQLDSKISFIISNNEASNKLDKEKVEKTIKDMISEMHMANEKELNIFLMHSKEEIYKEVTLIKSSMIKEMDEIKTLYESKMNENEYKLDSFRSQFFLEIEQKSASFKEEVNAKFKLLEKEFVSKAQIELPSDQKLSQSLPLEEIKFEDAKEKFEKPSKYIAIPQNEIKINFDEQLYNYSKEEIIKNNYLFYVDSKKFPDILHLKNVTSEEKFHIQLYHNVAFNDAAYHQGSIFYCGGSILKPSLRYLNNCAIYEIANGKLNFSSKLTELKDRISLSSTSTYIYCIGGFNGYNSKSTEFFRSGKNCWERGPNLNIPDRRITSFFNGNQYLFTFGGYTNEKIERLDILSSNTNWELLKIKMSKRNFGCALSLNKEEIIIFGGEHALSKFFIFDYKKLNLVSLPQQFIAYTFQASKPIFTLIGKKIRVVSSFPERLIFEIDPKTLDYIFYEVDF